jgi:hypothetical protein
VVPRTSRIEGQVVFCSSAHTSTMNCFSRANQLSWDQATAVSVRQRASLCVVCFRQKRQYLLNSSFPVVVFLFLVVT